MLSRLVLNEYRTSIAGDKGTSLRCLAWPLVLFSAIPGGFYSQAECCGVHLAEILFLRAFFFNRLRNKTHIHL